MLKIFFLHVHDKGKKIKKYTFKTSLQYLLVSREKKIIGYKNVKSYKDRGCFEDRADWFLLIDRK